MSSLSISSTITLLVKARVERLKQVFIALGEIFSLSSLKWAAFHETKNNFVLFELKMIDYLLFLISNIEYNHIIANYFTIC